MAMGNKSTVKPNPPISAGLINKAFFWWLKDLISHGLKHEIAAEDLYEIIPEDLTETLRKSFEIAWQREIDEAHKKKRKPKLWNAVAKIYGWEFLKLCIFPTGFSILLTLGPSFLELLMSYFRPTSTITEPQAYVIATAFVFLMVVRSLLFNHSLFLLNRLGMRARIACTSLTYMKMIRLSGSCRSSGSSAISLITVDVSKLETLFIFVPFVVIVPLQFLATTLLIWQYIDLYSTLVTMALMLCLTLPIQVLYNKIVFKLRRKQTTRTSQRISLIDEIISGIRSVKMYVWENYFDRCVCIARRLEVKGYLNISHVTSAVWALSNICHRLCIFVLILIYLQRYGTITVDQILPVALHFNNIRMCFLVYLFLGIRRITDMRVSMKRIEDFLLLQEVDQNVVKITNGNTDDIILINSVTVSSDDQSRILQNIDLNFAPKSLYAIVGAVGSGKSSLLKLILGELRLTSGKVFVNGKVSYASQEPWLFPASIRENILFGEEYDEERYEKVVSACALMEDFAQLPYADKTVVSDKGMNLSGGQCARVNLARAVYRDANIYLFDNPLSAVDTRVAKNVMEECINKLLRDKTRLFVTHNMELLTRVDEVIFLNSGEMEFRGTFENFRRNDLYLKDLAAETTEISDHDLQKFKFNATEPNTVMITPKVKKESKETEELIAKGVVRVSVYTRYIKAGGIYFLFLLLLLNIIVAVLMTLFDYGLIAWIQDKNSIYNTANVTGNVGKFNSSQQNNFSLLFGGLILLMMSMSFLLYVGYNRFLLLASNIIHNKMFRQVIKTSLRFFETNTSGRILNRFSEDTKVVDDTLPEALLDSIQAAVQAIALLFTVLIVKWWFIIPIGISIFVYFMIGKMHLVTTQRLTRLAGIANSSILSFVASSLDGRTTIRSCKAENIVSKEFDSRQDRHTSAQFLARAIVPANSLWIHLSNQGFLALVVYLCIICKNENTHAYVGLALMQVMNTSTIMSNIIIRFCAALSYMPNVERMLQFTHLESEGTNRTEKKLELETSCPAKGEIKFEKVYLRYTDDDSDPVLWNLNFTVVPGSNVGIVGRTGAGKSSLISALFRLANIEGSLFIDGVDITNVDLRKLRSKVSIIPQEPFLFKGTLRKNLVPLDEFEDALLWSALDNVELKKSFPTLESPINLGGSNLSLGQRQLVCLARAILRQNKILILDEATANIDLSTDALIQKMIRSKFEHCTVLTIAHRLSTVIDSDKILVMDNGRVVEYDHPFVLLQSTDGHFSKMVEQTDHTIAKQLKEVAEQVYKSSEKFKII